MEQPKQLTADEFLVWAMEQPEGRYELQNGLVVAPSPERLGHVIAKRNILIALHDAIGRRSLPCQALPDGATVRVNGRPAGVAIVRDGPLALDPPGLVIELGTSSPASDPRRAASERLPSG
jgi:Uma2 family endonuclease